MKGNRISQGDERIGPSQRSQGSPPHRILVVDDDTDLLLLNSEMLIDHGYEVDAAEDGSAAWEALNTARYDLLITDNNMPKVTGVELIKKLCAAGVIVPTIMATGTFPNEELTRHPWLQPVTPLRKPYTLPELLRAVKEVLHATDSAGGQIARCQNSEPTASRS